MKKYILPLTLALLVICNGLYAGSVSLSDAQNVALNFFKVTNTGQSAVTLSANLKYTKLGANGTAIFYVFDISPVRGFVIVASDDNVIPILGYSTESNFNINFSHTGLSSWIYKTSTNISRALQNNVVADARIQGQWSAYRRGLDPNASRSGGVGPLCATRWDQEMDTTTSPPPFLYNLFCPYIAADTQRCLTGCEATAMAQVMKYWNYPAQGMGSFSYVDDTTNGYQANIGTLSSDFASHTYQWQLMPTELLDNTPYAEDSAVDLLMYDCAVSIETDFGDDNLDGSGAEALLVNELPYDSFCTQYALPRYFGYNADTIRGVFEDSFSASAWTALIEHELNMGRPVIYEGYDYTQDTSGHAWVCDGYDVNNYLHMNWGWSGDGNGFFAINNLYTTASGGPFNPIDLDDALIGILPNTVTSGVASVSSAITFNIYPNPASNEVILQTNISGNDATWNIKNIMGQTLADGSITGALTHVNIDNLASGVYLLELQVGDKSMVKKLVVSR